MISPLRHFIKVDFISDNWSAVNLLLTFLYNEQTETIEVHGWRRCLAISTCQERPRADSDLECQARTTGVCFSHRDDAG